MVINDDHYITIVYALVLRQKFPTLSLWRKSQTILAQQLIGRSHISKKESEKNKYNQTKLEIIYKSSGDRSQINVDNFLKISISSHFKSRITTE